MTAGRDHDAPREEATIGGLELESTIAASQTADARAGTIFIDHFHNGRGATAVLPYAPRARAGAPVALPVSWKELPQIAPQRRERGLRGAAVASGRSPGARARQMVVASP